MTRSAISREALLPLQAPSRLFLLSEETVLASREYSICHARLLQSNVECNCMRFFRAGAAKKGCCRARRCRDVRHADRSTKLTSVRIREGLVHVRSPRLQEVREPEGKVANRNDKIASHGRFHAPVSTTHAASVEHGFQHHAMEAHYGPRTMQTCGSDPPWPRLACDVILFVQSETVESSLKEHGWHADLFCRSVKTSCRFWSHSVASRAISFVSARSAEALSVDGPSISALHHEPFRRE